MPADALRPAVQDAQDALRAFLATLLGAEAPLVAGAPAEVAAADPLPLVLVARPPGGAPFAVALSEGWAPALAQAMLGGPVDPAEAGDLLQEVAAQALGALRARLAPAGLAVPDAPLLAADADALAALPAPLWRVPFSLQHDGQALEGAAYLPPMSLPEPAPAPQAAPRPEPVDVARPAFDDFGAENFLSGDGGHGNLALLSDVELEVTVELGRRRLPLSDVLRLTTGSIIELENLVGQPLEVYANGRLIAEGEAVVIDEQFGVRITSLAAQRKRQKAML